MFRLNKRGQAEIFIDSGIGIIGLKAQVSTMITRSLRFAVICFGAMLTLLSLVEARTINVAIPCYCFQYVPFFVAKDRRYYREEDLDVQLVVMGGGIGLRALIGGNVEFAATG